MGVRVKEIISEVGLHLEPSDAILLYLSIILEGEHAPNLLQFLPEEAVQALQPFVQNLLSIPEGDRHFPLLDEIQKLSQEKSHRAFEEMDGSWIVHYLKDEKPSVIGLILKRLSTERGYQVLHAMKPELKDKLPNADELEQVPEEVIHVVRKCFEDQLVAFEIPARPKKLEFGSVFNLNGGELLILVRDLGLHLLSLAFQNVEERSLVELLKNLDEPEAEALFEQFKSHAGTGRGDIKNAQLELLTLSLDFASGKDLILEAGVQRLARALVEASDEEILLMQHRLPLKQGYQLNRYCDDLRHGHQPATVTRKYQDLLVHRLYTLSHAGDIDRSWARMQKAGAVSRPLSEMRALEV